MAAKAKKVTFSGKKKPAAKKKAKGVPDFPFGQNAKGGDKSAGSWRAGDKPGQTHLIPHKKAKNRLADLVVPSRLQAFLLDAARA